MNKILFMLVSIATVNVLSAMEVVKVVSTSNDGKVSEYEIVAEKISKNVSRVVIPAKNIAKDCKFLDVKADCATNCAKKGDEGYWLMRRGEMGFFNKDNENYSTWWSTMYMPYYAMKTPKETFIAVIDGMRFEFVLKIDVIDGVYSMYPRWQIKDIGFAPYEDITITYYTLPKDADYNDMAKVYRKHRFAQNEKIKPMKKRFATQPYLEKMAKSIPVRLIFAQKPFNRKTDEVNFYPRGGKPFEDKKYQVKTEREEHIPETPKFEDGIKKLQMLKDRGIDDVAVCVGGWQSGGYDGRCPTAFPVCEEAGGEESLKKLIKAAQDMGYIIDGHSNYTDAFTCSPDWSPDNICKTPDGKLAVLGAWRGGTAYSLCLINAFEKYVKPDLDKISKLGFKGAHYIDVFTCFAPHRCCDPKHAGNRKEIGEYQRKISGICREKFGGYASECSMDHIIENVDYINYVSPLMRIKYDNKRLKFVDKFVPFFELVYHDVVLSNPDRITQNVLTQENNLRLVEFGGRPIFYHISNKNIDYIQRAYQQFLTLRHLQIEEMLSYKEVAENVFEIKYGNGDVVIVNRSQKPFKYREQMVDAMSFKLLKQSIWKRILNIF